MSSDEKVTNVRSTAFGYRYQNLIGVSRLIDLLNEKAEQVYFEQKETINDKFDDMKVFIKNDVHHYQIKASYSENELKLSDFYTDNLKIELTNLYESWESLTHQFQDKNNYFHIYTTKSIPEKNSLIKYLNKISDNRTIFSENPSTVYTLKSEILNEDKFQKIKEKLQNKGISGQRLNKFLNSLIIEVKQPENPPDIFRLNSEPSPLEKIILDKITNLGLHEPPNNIPQKITHDTLFNLVNKTSVKTTKIDKDTLEEFLDIKRNFDSIKNAIDFDENQYVLTLNEIAKLNEQLSKSSGDIMCIKGKPGCGKSWLLTKWCKEFEKNNSDSPPIWYYSSISVTDDDAFEKRITKQQIINNLRDEIRSSYNIEEESDKYAATIKKLQELINQLGIIGVTKSKVIPIIIDGLDHVTRIKQRSMNLSERDETVLDFINEIKIPKGVCFVFGTQEGAHLNNLKIKFGEEKFHEIFGFNESETKIYLEKLEVKPDLLQTENIKIIFEKTRGLPLLANYLGKILKGKEKFDDVKDIPITDGNVGVYYQYLFQGLNVASNTRIFARYLSLLEFASGNVFLDMLRPSSTRDGEELNSCLNPLLPLLRENKREEISIFHDSFREFILTKTDFSQELQLSYTADIYNALKKASLVNNSISFRYAMKYALKAQKFDEIVKIVNLEYVDNAMNNLVNRNDLENNISYAIRASYEKNSFILILEKGLLRRYTIERYEYLNSYQFDELILRLYPDRIEKLLVTEDRLNFSLNETLWFLANSIKNQIDLPYEYIFEIWEKTLSKTKRGQIGYLPEDTTLSDFAIVVFVVKGSDAIVNWINKNDFSLMDTTSILIALFKFMNYDSFEELRSHITLSEEYNLAISLHAYAYYKRTKQFVDNLKLVTEKHTDLIFKIGFKRILLTPHVTSEMITPLLRQITIEIPQHRDINVSNLKEFEMQVMLNSYCDNSAELQNYQNRISIMPNNLFKQTLNLIFQYGKLRGLKSKLSIQDAKEMLVSLQYFIDYYDDRLFDEPGYWDKDFKSYMKNKMENVFKLIIENGSKEIKDELLELVLKMGNKYMFTSLSIDDALRILLKYSDEDLSDKIKSKISYNISFYTTQEMVDSCLDKSLLCLQANKIEESKQFFEKAIEFTFSYGYHKDLHLYEIQEISHLIKDENYLVRTKNIMNLTEYLDIITDGDETNQIPNEVIGDSMEHNSTASFDIALLYGIDSFVFEEALSQFAKKCKDCPTIIRYFLAKTRVIHGLSHRYTSREAFSIRIGVITEAIEKNDFKLARFLLEDLRIELERDFPERYKHFQDEFNKLANQSSVQLLKLENIHDIEESISHENSTLDYSDLKPEELIKEFEQNYGWSWGHSRHTDNLLITSYNKDKSKTEKLMITSLANRCLNYHYEPQGAISVFGRYLSSTNQQQILKNLYEKIIPLVNSLFRNRDLLKKHDFDFLDSFISDDPITTGCKFLVSQLSSYDTQVQRLSFVSIISCLRNNAPGLLHYCISIIGTTDNHTLRAKLAFIIDSYVHYSKNDSKEIVDCATSLCKMSDRRLVLAGENILRNIGIHN